MPREEEQVVGEPGRESLAPGRFSALLRAIAHVPDAEIASTWDRALGPGAVIGRFELVREVGRGGFGVVYEARDRELGRTVAFKAVRPGKALDVREEQLLREADAAARLSHPNIVTLFDVGRSEHGPYLVLEFLRGQTLAQRMEQGPLSALEALRVAVEVAKGLAHAHESGVVHRDLKSGNVFLCHDGQVKVLDLGMAHAFGRPRVAGGTPGYMAPEQRRGAPEDERTDVFSLGVILHSMLAGELPFPDRAGKSFRRAPTLEVPGAPALGGLIARMLEQDPVRRPRDAREVLPALKAFLQELERTPSPGRAASPAKRRRPRLRSGALVAAGLAAGIALAWWLARGVGSGPIAGAPSRPIASSIAVLPFADLSPQKDQEYFSDGLADEILNVLAGVEGLRVPSRTSSFFFKGKSVRLADIGRELNVRAVLEGSVRKAGNRVRVTAQIVNVADGYRMWAHTYDRDLTDIFAVQDEIARAVVAALDVKLLGERATPTSGMRATESPEAYTQYLLGRQSYYRYTAQSLPLAVQAYERALALDPLYAPAWAGLGLPLYEMAGLARTTAEATALRRRALAAAARAVELSPDLSEALSTRGFLRAAIEYDWTGAKADLERAVAVNGNDADAHRRYGILLEDLGRLPEAMVEVRKAVDLDPLGPSWFKLGALYQAAGELDRAEAVFRRHLRILPDALPGLVLLSQNLLLQSRPADALAVLDRCPEEDRLWGTAIAERELGHPAQAQAALETLVARYGHTRALAIAEVYAWRGERDRAFEWLDRAISRHMSETLRSAPLLRGLRDDPRYPALLRRMNLPVD